MLHKMQELAKENNGMLTTDNIKKVLTLIMSAIMENLEGMDSRDVVHKLT